MLRRSITLILTILCAASGAATDPKSLDFCFKAALQRSELIADQSEQIIQAEEHYRQAIGSVLPQITGTASYMRQETPANSTAIFPSSQPLVKVTLTQPLFRGFREFAALRQTEKLGDAQRAAKGAAELQLFYDVSQNYYTVLSLERDIDNLTGEIELYGKRIGDLNSRVRIGRSRIAEVLTVQTSLSALKAEMEMVKGQLAANREAFVFLTGLPADTSLEDRLPNPAKLEPVTSYVAGLEKRPDVTAAKLRFDAAREATSIAQGGHWPSADLTGNYYFKRFGLQDQIHWDVGVTLTVPIFSGGVTQSQVHEARSKEMQSELAVTRSKRSADQEIKSIYRNVESSLAQVSEYKKTTELASKNFGQQEKEYRLGLVNNLDVLNALTTFQQSQRSLDQARYQAAINFEKLEAASGKNTKIAGK
jgi:outer membrane protein